MSVQNLSIILLLIKSYFVCIDSYKIAFCILFESLLYLQIW